MRISIYFRLIWFLQNNKTIAFYYTMVFQYNSNKDTTNLFLFPSIQYIFQHTVFLMFLFYVNIRNNIFYPR